VFTIIFFVICKSEKIVHLRMQLFEVIRESLDSHPVYEWCSHLNLML